MGGWLAALFLPADLCIMTDDGTQGLSLLNESKLARGICGFSSMGSTRRWPRRKKRRSTGRRWEVLPEDTVIAAINRLAPAKRMERCLSAFAEIVERAPIRNKRNV